MADITLESGNGNDDTIERNDNSCQSSSKGHRSTSGPEDNSEDPMMMAVYYEKTGKIEDVLRVGLRPAPTKLPSGDWMLVRVHAASCNPIDVRYMQGDYAVVRRPKHLPHVPGFDFSGVIEKVGKDVHGFEEGDAVFGTNFKTNGTMAELVMVRKDWVVKKPAHLTHEEAAAIPLAGLTAYQALTCSLRLRPGEGLIILGGSTDVGMFAIQIAKILGASRVAVTSSAEDLCKQLGADVVINNQCESWAENLSEDQSIPLREAADMSKSAEETTSKGPVGPDLKSRVVHEEDEVLSKQKFTNREVSGSPRQVYMTEEERKNTYHVVLDCIGGAWKLVKKFPGITRFCTIVGDSDNGLTVAKLFSNGAHMIARHMKGLLKKRPEYHFMLTDFESPAHLHAVLEMVNDHRLQVVLDPEGSFVLTDDSVKSMFERQASHHLKGKLVLSLQDVVSSRIEMVETATRKEAEVRELQMKTEDAHKDMVKRAEEDHRCKLVHDLIQAGPTKTPENMNEMDVMTQDRLEMLLQLHNQPES